MNLAMYVEALSQQLTAVAEMGDAETRGVVDRLSTGLEAAARVVLLEAISAAADEITAELAPGAVEVRLRGSDPQFVVTLPSDVAGDATDASHLGAMPGGEEGGTARLNLRLPEALKGRIEEAARQQGLSLNTWLVRAAASAVEGPQRPVSTSDSRRYTGWVR